MCKIQTVKHSLKPQVLLYSCEYSLGPALQLEEHLQCSEVVVDTDQQDRLLQRGSGLV